MQAASASSTRRLGGIAAGLAPQSSSAESYETALLKFALPSGSLQDATVDLFARANFNIEFQSRDYFPDVDHGCRAIGPVIDGMSTYMMWTTSFIGSIHHCLRGGGCGRIGLFLPSTVASMKLPPPLLLVDPPDPGEKGPVPGVARAESGLAVDRAQALAGRLRCVAAMNILLLPPPPPPLVVVVGLALCDRLLAILTGVSTAVQPSELAAISLKVRGAPGSALCGRLPLMPTVMSGAFTRLPGCPALAGLGRALSRPFKIPPRLSAMNASPPTVSARFVSTPLRSTCTASITPPLLSWMNRPLASPSV